MGEVVEAVIDEDLMGPHAFVEPLCRFFLHLCNKII